MNRSPKRKRVYFVHAGEENFNPAEAIRAEIAEAKYMLSRCPENDPFCKLNFQGRIHELEKELAEELENPSVIRRIPKPIVTRAEILGNCKAEIAYLEDLISRIPEEAVLDRLSFEGRLEEVRKEAAQREKELNAVLA